MKKQIRNLQTKIASSAHIWYEALVGLADEETDKVASTILTACVKGIGEAADSAHLIGLSTVCELFCQNLADLPTSDPANRWQIGLLIERWPRLVSNYLHSPHDSNSYHQLISFLQDTQWSQPATDDLVNQLRERFQRCVQVLENEEKAASRLSVAHEHLNESTEAGESGDFQEPINEKTVNMKKPVEPVQVVNNNDQLAELSHKIVQLNNTLSFALNQLVTLRIENEACYSGMKQYTDTVQSFWEIAAKIGLKGFQEVCTFINDNVFECISQSPKERLKLQGLFALWPSLAVLYLESPEKGANKLVDFLRQPLWPISLEESRADSLLTQLIQDCEIRNVIEPQPPVSTSPPPNETAAMNKNESQSFSGPTEAPELSENEPDWYATEEELPREKENIEQSKAELAGKENQLGEEADKLAGEELSCTNNQEFSAQPNPYNDKEQTGKENQLAGNVEEFSSDKDRLVSENSQSALEAEELLASEPTQLTSDNIAPEDSPLFNEEKPLTNEHSEKNHLMVDAEEIPSHESEQIVREELQLIHSESAKESTITDEDNPIPNDEEEFSDELEQFTKNNNPLANEAEELAGKPMSQLVHLESDEASLITCENNPIADDENQLSDELEQLDVEYNQLTKEEEDKFAGETSQLSQDESGQESHWLAEPEEQLTGYDSPLLEDARELSSEHQQLPDQAGDLLPNEEELPPDQLLHKTDDQLPMTNDFVLAEPDVLELLIAQMGEMAEENAKLVNDLIEAEAGSETQLTAAMNYTENVQAVWDAAEMAGLEGLKDICTFINDNVMALGGENLKEVRTAAYEVLSAWPEFVVAYLQSPVSFQQKQEQTTDLVSHLQQTAWPTPLDSEAATALQQHLMKTASAVPEDASDSTSTGAPKEKESELPALEMLAEPDVLELLIAQMGEMTEENAQIINELIEAEPGSETQLTAAMNYTENVQSVWEVADMAGLEGLKDICTFINDNVMALGAENITEVRSAARQVLFAWPELVVAYLQTQPSFHQRMEKIAALVNHLQPTAWPTPLDSEAATRLQQQLMKTATTVPEEASDSTPIGTKKEEESELPALEELAQPDVLELLIAQMGEMTDENAQIINELIEAEPGSETQLTAAMNYTENVQAVWEVADMAGLEGLKDICTFINDNVMALGAENLTEVRSAARQVLFAWPELVVAYLQTPPSFHQRMEKTAALVNHLQPTVWPAPLDFNAATRLQQNLMKAASSAIDSTPTDVPKEEVIELAAPEILELLTGQIADSSVGMSAAIEVCVSMENETEAFLEAVDDYTNKVQDIWDAAEMAGLTGLQEVCTFINDNLMAFSVQEKANIEGTQTYFIEWPAKVLEYLQTPSTGASSLSAYLTETGWPSPLEAGAADNLLTLLKTPSGHTEEVSPSETSVPDSHSDDSAIVKASSEDLTPLKAEVSEEISLGNNEILEILTTELSSTQEELATQLNRLITAASQKEPAFAEALENYTEHVQRLYVASEMLGLEGLQTICSFVIDNITALGATEIAEIKKAKSVLEQWPNLVLAYVQSPSESVVPLANHFRNSTWAQPLNDEAAHTLLNQLVAGSTAEEEAEEENSRQTVASPEDVLLTIPDDVNPELWQAYLQEAPQNASDFSATIQNIIQKQETAEIERAQRIAHTLKGSSNIIGIKAIANIAHHLEDTLEYLAKHQVVPPKELTDTMVEAADCLEIMVDSLLGQDDPPQQAQQVLQSVLDWANRIDKGKLDAPPAPSRPPPTAEPSGKQGEAAKAPDQAKKAPEVAAGTPEQFLRVPTKTVDELMRLVGELSISVGQIQEKLKHVIQSTRTLTEQDLVLHKKTFELENLVDVRGITGIDNRNRKKEEEESNELDFDPLELEEYNELHSVAHSFIESIADNRELAMSIREELGELETMFIHQERLNKDFQANIMTTRMVPVNTILSKVQRNVRQTCRMTGKQAELEVTGTDILIDSDVLNNLADPLQHILRNAIDHGIENPDERAILGKPENGKIQLIFYREGNNIVVKCVDDGQGLNYTNIRFTAIQRGLITENQEVTENELARLILMSGFSTKSGVTQVSGRGVGMDVVHTNIRQMKGTLDLISETGKGTTMLIKLPMTLVTVHVLLVRIGDYRFGIPTNHLEQALAAGVGEFQRVGDEITFKMDKNFYALKYLADLLNMPGDKVGVEDPETRPILLVREETGITAAIVDEFLDTHDLVMKNMGKYMKNIHGVVGASILGDGSLVPLLDLPELLRSPMQSAMSSYMAENEDEDGVAGKQALPYIMIVDDSLSVRKSLSLLIEDAGFEALLAKDGVEAIEMMNQNRPNVMLVDMEMPRMNGLELTAHVRANQITQNLPIFMITSRTTEKHREQAFSAGVNAYLTKPYQDAELLDLIDKALTGQI